MAHWSVSSAFPDQLGQGPNNWYQSYIVPSRGVSEQSYSSHGGSGYQQGTSSEPQPWRRIDSSSGVPYQGSWPETPPEPTPTQPSISRAAPQEQRQRSVEGPTDQFVHKNWLQEFTQRATLPLPMYQTINEGHPHAPQFRSTVVVDGHTFTSSRTFIHKKAAEQDVARIALEGISTVIKHQGVPQVQEDPTFCKSILYEYAVKMNFEKPTYTTCQEGGGPLPMFVSSSIFNGETFTGTHAKNKKEAEQMAARAVIESVLANSNTRTLMCAIIKSKGKLYAAVHKSSFSGLSCNKDVVLRSQMQENANSCIVKGKEPETTLTNVNELPGNSYAADHQLAIVTATESSLPQAIKVGGWVAESTRVGFLKDNLNSGTVGNGSEAYAATQGLPAGVVSSTNNASKESHVQQDSRVNGCTKHTGESMEPGGCPTGALNTCRNRSKQNEGNESKKARTDEQTVLRDNLLILKSTLDKVNEALQSCDNMSLCLGQANFGLPDEVVDGLSQKVAALTGSMKWTSCDCCKNQ